MFQLMRRLTELDALRGLAALMVVVHHDLFASRVLDGSLLRQTPLRGLDAGRPFVLLFFVLSGFVLSRSLGEKTLDGPYYVTWMVQRAVRLLVPAAASVLLAAALYRLFADPVWAAHGNQWFSWNWSASPTLVTVAAQSALVTQPDLNAALWSLAVEWRLSFLIIPAVWFARSSRHGGLALIGVSLALAGIAGGSAPTAIYAGTDPFSILRSTLYFTLPFALGVALDRSDLCRLEVDRAVVIAAVLACVGLARVEGDIAAFLWSALVIWTVQLRSPLRTWLRMALPVWLGRVSFSLYLIHVPLMLGAFHALHDRLPPVGIAAIAIGSSVAAAAVFHRAVEQPALVLARALRPRAGMSGAAGAQRTA